MSSIFNLDEIDHKILQELLVNARASITELAEKIGTSRVTIRSRLKKLVDEKIIQSFTVELNPDVFSQGVEVFITLKASDVDEITKILENEDVIHEIYHTAGEKNVFCKAEIPNITNLKDLLNKIAELNVPFETSVVINKIKQVKPIPKILSGLRCNYCGKKITEDPHVLVLNNKKYYFCCDTCKSEFKKKMKFIEGELEARDVFTS